MHRCRCSLPIHQSHPTLQSRPLIGVVSGASVLILAPLVGFAATAVLLQRAFGNVATADPSEKARRLAEGISEAMNCTAAGLVVGVLGAVVFIVSLVILLRRRASLSG
jgi:biopolymer transport protein ExbB/TolQ